ncbi:hypothetical protein BC940DRAFT_333770 [Gongronella butleri]|nr:hypothetical protein BC940DRAFT_333770 [Gongronella butleri]
MTFCLVTECHVWGVVDGNGTDDQGARDPEADGASFTALENAFPNDSRQAIVQAWQEKKNTHEAAFVLMEAASSTPASMSSASVQICPATPVPAASQSSASDNTTSLGDNLFCQSQPLLSPSNGADSSNDKPAITTKRGEHDGERRLCRSIDVCRVRSNFSSSISPTF